MSTIRVNVSLSHTEANALIQMAKDDCRQPREQLRYILRAEAQRLGLLPATQGDTGIHGSAPSRCEPK